MHYRLQNLNNNLFFVLPATQAVSIDINSNLFTDNGNIIGSMSYPGNMELEPNRKQIQNAQYIATSIGLRQIPVMIWLGYLPWKQVVFKFTIENDKINYTLNIDATIIINQLKTATLVDMIDPDGPDQVVFESPADLQNYMLTTATAKPGTYPAIYFPFKNDGAYKAIDSPVTVMVDKGDYNAATNSPALHNAPAIAPGGAVAGWFYHVTNTGAVDCGAGAVAFSAGEYAVFDGNVWSASATRYGIPVAGLTDIAAPVNKYMNAWEVSAGGVGSFSVDPAGAPVNQTHMPSFIYPYIIRRIAKFFGYTTQGKWLDEDDSNRLCLITNIASEVLIQADMTYYMPSTLIPDFLTDCRTRFGLLIDFDATRKVMTIESLANLLVTKKIVDLRKSQRTTYRETGLLSDAYTITQNAGGNDTAYTDQEKAALPVLVVGDTLTAISEKDITLTSVATKMLTETSPAEVLPAEWRVPWIKQPVFGNTPLDQISTVTYADRNKFDLRVLYYMGMKPDAAGYNYPYASSDNLDYLGNQITTFTLALNPQGSAYLSMLQYYNFMLNSKPAEYDFKLTPAQIASITADTLFLVYDFNSATISCFLDQMSVDITNDEELMAKITLYPIVMPDNAAQVIPAVPIVPPGPPVDNGLVFAKLIYLNPFESPSVVPPHYITYGSDLYVAFFEDVDATVPKNVTSLTVRLQTLQYDNGFLIGTYSETHVLTSVADQAILQAAAPNTLNEGEHIYVWVYSLLPSAYYTVIT